MGSVRTFVAVELPDEVVRTLAAVIDGLREAGDGVRWVRPEGIHLTLKFLGDVEEAQIPGVVAAVARVAGEVAPFTLQTAGVGGFPSRDRARVLWVGIEGDSGALKRLQAGVERVLHPLGFPPERRRFTAHVTLGRARRRPVTLLRDMAGPTEPVRFWVARVDVMKSDLRPEGAVYSVLGGGALGVGHDCP